MAWPRRCRERRMMEAGAKDRHLLHPGCWRCPFTCRSMRPVAAAAATAAAAGGLGLRHAAARPVGTCRSRRRHLATLYQFSADRPSVRKRARRVRRTKCDLASDCVDVMLSRSPPDGCRLQGDAENDRRPTTAGQEMAAGDGRTYNELAQSVHCSSRPTNNSHAELRRKRPICARKAGHTGQPPHIATLAGLWDVIHILFRLDPDVRHSYGGAQPAWHEL